jgi:hypothetical protein
MAVPESPTLVLVAGRDSGTDKLELLRQLRGRSVPLRIVTFDDVRAALEREHARRYAALEDLPGAAWFSVVRIIPDGTGRPVRLFRVVDPASASRLFIYVDGKGRLVFEVTGRSGQSHSVRAGLLERQLDRDRFWLISCEFGSSDSLTLLQIRIDDRLVAELRLREHVEVSADLDLEGPYAVLGCDGDEVNGGMFQLATHLGYSRILTFRERLGLVEWFADKYAGAIGPVVEFHPTAGMHTANR